MRRCNFTIRAAFLPAVLFLALSPLHVRAATYIWTGSGGDSNWTTDANWDIGAPANPNTDTIQLDTNAVDNHSQINTDWQVGNIDLDTLGGGNFTHDIDLGSNTLTLANGISRSGSYSGKNYANLIIHNGTLQLGKSGSSANINLGDYHIHNELRCDPSGGARINTFNVGSISLSAYGASGAPTARVDIRNAEVVGGTFEVGNLTLSHGGAMLMDTNTVIEKFFVRGTFDMPKGTSYSATFSTLPGGVDFQVGQPSADGAIKLPKGNTIDAEAGNGVFTAYLSTFQVGGTVDMSLMSSCIVDAADADVVIGDATVQNDGSLKLPPGTATFGSLSIGDSNKTGTLVLDRTFTTVNGNAAFNAGADITINVGAEDEIMIVEGVSTFASGASIFIDFQVDPGEGVMHAGLKIKGDYVDELASVVTWDESELSDEVEIFKRPDGYTYVGIPPPKGTVFMLK
ncbi:MAG: hypothetical protein R6V03_07835 [Kiritimatiellia bacterium]